MKKVINLVIVLLLTICMTVVSSVSVFAEENTHTEEVDVETLIAEAERIAEEENISLRQNEAYIKESVQLDDDVTLTIELYDLEEGEQIEDVLLAATSSTGEGDYIGVPSGSMETVDYIPYRTVYKDYGNRYFTAKYTFGYPTGSVTILTENHYSIGDYGLKARYGVTTPSHIGTFSGFKARWDITDGTATTVGSDINIEGLIEYQIGSNSGASKGPRHMKLDTRVRLDKLDKSGKRAQVTEHAYFSRTKTVI